MRIRTISSLEKCFLDENIETKKELKRATMLKNEQYHYEVCFDVEDLCNDRFVMRVSVDSPIADYVTVRRIEHVPVQMPVNRALVDDNYLRTTPGLYPDLLMPLDRFGRVTLNNNLQSLFVEIDPKGEVAPGVYDITLNFTEEEAGQATEKTFTPATFTIEILDAELPEQSLIFTQWFYCDCLQNYYGTEMFDERHWQIIENFVKVAVARGINMLLTPVFTPPLDTYVGGERGTAQLVDITLENGKYSFGFEKLGRWVEMCNRNGIKYFEIAHFFTQWGAAHAPKIMATVDGEYKRIFGWDTKADGEEYSAFLHAFVPALLDYMKSLDGADQRCYFHISDEPTFPNLEQYKASREVVREMLEGYPVIDALSDFRFYSMGLVERPVPANNEIEEFLEHNVPDLWVYYCTSQSLKVSNRFMSMPSARNRIIGVQMYKHNIVGFLQWGFNSYYNRYSFSPVNPYLITDAEYFVPAGDAFQVFPAPDGTAYETLRLVVFHEALQDMRAMQLCEQLYGREFVMNLIEDGVEPITFSEYPKDAEYLLNLREKINRAIADKLCK